MLLMHKDRRQKRIMLTWSSKFTLPYPSSTAPTMTVIEEIDDANRLIHCAAMIAGSIPNTLFSIRIEYLWSKLTCTKYALLLCVVVAGADVNGTPPFTHKSSGLPYPN